MLNEELAIGATLDAIRAGAPGAETIVVDGGSTDRSIEIASTRGAQTLTAIAVAKIRPFFTASIQL